MKSHLVKNHLSGFKVASISGFKELAADAAKVEKKVHDGYFINGIIKRVADYLFRGQIKLIKMVNNKPKKSNTTYVMFDTRTDMLLASGSSEYVYHGKRYDIVITPTVQPPKKVRIDSLPTVFESPNNEHNDNNHHEDISQDPLPNSKKTWYCFS
jgi:hypothetical protein